MKNQWIEIESWIKEKAPDLMDALRLGAEPEAIEGLENQIGKKLPEDFVEFYKIHDGGEEGVFLIDGKELLPVELIAEEWTGLKDDFIGEDYDAENRSDEDYSKPDKGIKDNWWNPLWIPMAQSDGGDYYCLDLDPAEGGNYGQVISWLHDDVERKLIASSFSEWIAHFISQLKNGEQVYSEDFNGIVPKEWKE